MDALLAASADSPLFAALVDGDTDGVKVINDPIHGHFELPRHALQFIDTPHIQRLRDLKQLGGTYLVYPGASQNRFEHSVGVSHLSESFVRGLYASPRARPSQTFDGAAHFQDALRNVRIAGLCHDLGHGPFSHLFDYRFLRNVTRIPGIATHPHAEHETRSIMLLEHLIDTYGLDYDREAIRHISSLITGRRPIRESSKSPRFLYDVVANQTCGIDTDRFDYIARDVYNVGLQGCYGFDHKRLMKFAKVIDDHICFHHKEIFNVYHLFLTRFQLHRTVYNHRAAIAIDSMIADAFFAADPVLHLAESITDPKEFMAMTDSLLHAIEFSKDYRLAEARRIVSRLRHRNLYSFVDELLLPAGSSSRISVEDITTCQDGRDVNLVPDDIVLATVTLNFGMKRENPIDSVRFFRDWSDTTPMHISSSKVSYVIPATFEEKILRLYLRRDRNQDTPRYKAAAKRAFRNFTKRENLGSPLPSPPLPARKRESDGSSMLRAPPPITLDGIGMGDSVAERPTANGHSFHQ